MLHFFLNINIVLLTTEITYPFCIFKSAGKAVFLPPLEVLPQALAVPDAPIREGCADGEVGAGPRVQLVEKHLVLAFLERLLVFATPETVAILIARSQLLVRLDFCTHIREPKHRREEQQHHKRSQTNLEPNVEIKIF